MATDPPARFSTTMPAEDGERFERYCRDLGLQPATQLRRLIYAALADAAAAEQGQRRAS